MRFFKLLMAAVLMINFSSAAQKNPEPVVIHVVYQFVHVYNLNEKEKPVKKEMVLSVGKSSSRYIGAEVFDRVTRPVQVTMPNARVYQGKPVVMVNNQGAVINENIFQYPLAKSMSILTALGNNSYITEAPLVPIRWKIESETRQIGGFECQKATGEFGGRVFTAWFAADLPFQNGPFKLWGLPGLILEAEDSKKEVRFLFKDIVKETDASKKIDLMGAGPVKISYADYSKAKKAYQSDPESFMQGQLSANAPKVTKMSTNGSDAGAKKILSNPIELK